MRTILMSEHSKEIELVMNGEKTILAKRAKPNIDEKFKVYIYCTRPKKYYRTSQFGVGSDEFLYRQCGKVKRGDYDYYDDKDVSYNGKVIGYFICDKIETIPFDMIETSFNVGNFITHVDDKYMPTCCDLNKTCLGVDELYDYAKGKDLYAWHISDLVIYYEPKELSKFWSPVNMKDASVGINKQYKITKAPNQWRYVEELYD